ncbi:MAG: hypothetical protein LIO41_01475 [Ruminococcus sp.]|nr:hypothetical protein [Ruminococcus sp.]
MVLANIIDSSDISVMLETLVGMLIFILIIVSIVGIYRQSHKQTDLLIEQNELLERQNELLMDIKYGRK